MRKRQLQFFGLVDSPKKVWNVTIVQPCSVYGGAGGSCRPVIGAGGRPKLV